MVLTGIAVILQLIVTVYILDAALGTLVLLLDPVVRALLFVEVVTVVENSPVIEARQLLGPYQSVDAFLAQLVTLVSLIVIVVGLEMLARDRYDARLIEYFHSGFVAVPGIGTQNLEEGMTEQQLEEFGSGPAELFSGVGEESTEMRDDR